MKWKSCWQLRPSCQRGSLSGQDSWERKSPGARRGTHPAHNTWSLRTKRASIVRGARGTGEQVNSLTSSATVSPAACLFCVRVFLGCLFLLFPLTSVSCCYKLVSDIFSLFPRSFFGAFTLFILSLTFVSSCLKLVKDFYAFSAALVLWWFLLWYRKATLCL